MYLQRITVTDINNAESTVGGVNPLGKRVYVHRLDRTVIAEKATEKDS
jgi:hypothetical protein